MSVGNEKSQDTEVEVGRGGDRQGAEGRGQQETALTSEEEQAAPDFHLAPWQGNQTPYQEGWPAAGSVETDTLHTGQASDPFETWGDGGCLSILLLSVRTWSKNGAGRGEF